MAYAARWTVPAASPYFVLMLGLLSALPPFGIDMGLPGIPGLQQDIGATAGQAAQTLTLFLFGFAAGPVFFGPLSDHYGRRPVLLGGVALFAIAGLACALAPNLETLLAARAMQGLGAGAAAALPAAIVRDVYRGEQGLARQSQVALANAVAPLIAPLIGAGLLFFGDWRTIYLALAVLGGALLVFAGAGLPETRPHAVAHPARGSLLGGALSAYRQVLADRQYLRATALLATTFGVMFAYIAGSSLVFMGELGTSSTIYALIFALTAAGTMTGAAANSRLVKRWGARPVITGAALVNVAAGATLLGLSALDLVSIGAVVACIVASNVCAGVILPNATHQALEHVGHVAGSASALQRALQMLAGGMAGALFGWLPGDRITAMSVTMLVFAVVAAACCARGGNRTSRAAAVV